MLYRVVIQKPVPNKSHPTPEESRRHQRVVIVEGATVREGVDFLRTTLELAGAFNDTTGHVVELAPVGAVVTLCQ